MQYNSWHFLAVPATSPLLSPLLLDMLGLKWRHCTTALHILLYSRAHKSLTACRAGTHMTVYARHVNYLIWLDMNECTYIFESSKPEACRRLTVLWRLCGVSLYDLCEFPVTAVINCHKPRGLKQHKFVVVRSLIHFWLCDLMDCSMLASPVLQHLLEFAQIHVHWVGHAI